jgi:hypothetical protein
MQPPKLDLRFADYEDVEDVLQLVSKQLWNLVLQRSCQC